MNALSTIQQQQPITNMSDAVFTSIHKTILQVVRETQVIQILSPQPERFTDAATLILLS